jgi:hypothetical protein
VPSGPIWTWLLSRICVTGSYRQTPAAPGSDAGHVADRYLDGVASRLLAQPVDHVLGLLDAVHADARLPERQGDPPGAHGELHVSNILAKLNVASRGEAAAVAHRLHLFG